MALASSARSSGVRSAARLARFTMAALGCAALIWGCAGESEPVPDIAMPGDDPTISPAEPNAIVLADFIGRLDRQSRKLTFERVEASGSLRAQALDQPQNEVPVSNDGVPGSGPENTVELITNGDVTFGQGFWQANVTLRHFLPRPLNNVFVQVYAVDPNDNQHNALNSDPGEYGLDNRFGLWKYTCDALSLQGPFGVFGQPPSHNAGSRDWFFADPGDAGATYHIRVLTAKTFTGYDYGFPEANPADPTWNACNDLNADPNYPRIRVTGAIGATSREFPFAFTAYGFTSRAIGYNNRGVLSLGFNNSVSDARSRVSTTTANPANNLLPAASPGGTFYKPGIFPFWDDLRYQSGGVGGMCSKLVGTEPQRKVVVTWENLATASGNAPRVGDSYTFSVVLHEGTNNIEFLYLNMVSAAAPDQAQGSSASIGIQNESATAAVQWSYANDGPINSGDAFMWVPSP